MKVLVTGAAGQLARLVMRALMERGDEVVGMDVRKRRHPDVDAVFEWVKRYDHRTVAEVYTPPGEITNRVLYVDGTQRLRAGLKPKIHFRALNPMMWFLAIELYGR